MTAAPKQITSLQNDRVKAIRALEMRKERKETGLFVAEGTSLLITARDNGFKPETLVYRTGAAVSGIAQGLVAWALNAGVECLEVSEAVLGKLSSKDNPQSMIGVFRQRWIEPAVGAQIEPGAVWLALEEVRDPGNLGTIIRTADAAGAHGIVTTTHRTAPVEGPGVERASAGAAEYVPVSRVVNLRDALERCREAGIWVVGADMDGDRDYTEADLKGPVILVMGEEGKGIRPLTRKTCDMIVRIPMRGKVASLNVSASAAILLFEVTRQRRGISPA